MADCRVLSVADLCSVLGFDKNDPSRRYYSLLSELHAFLEEYEASVKKVPPTKKADLEEATSCAYSFLSEKDRGERYWPQGLRGAPVWPRDKPMIMEAIANLLQRRSFSKYQKQLRQKKQMGDAKAEKEMARDKKAQKRPRSSLPISRRDDDSDSENEEADGLKRKFHLGPWDLPPERFGRGRCKRYLRSINPGNDGKDLGNITIHWLRNRDLSWPESLDGKLQREMHRLGFYWTGKLHKDTKALEKFIVQLMKGTRFTADVTKVAQEKGTQRQLEERMKFYTTLFADNRFVEFGTDGIAAKTILFKEFWDLREEFWNENIYEVPESQDHWDEQPNKKRKKGRLSTLYSTPEAQVDFPNLFERRTPRSTPEPTSASEPEKPEAQRAENSRLSSSQLKIMAGSALGKLDAVTQQDNNERSNSAAQAASTSVFHSDAFTSPTIRHSPEALTSPTTSVSGIDEDVPPVRPLAFPRFPNTPAPSFAETSKPVGGLYVANMVEPSHGREPSIPEGDTKSQRINTPDALDTRRGVTALPVPALEIHAGSSETNYPGFRANSERRSGEPERRGEQTTAGGDVQAPTKPSTEIYGLSGENGGVTIDQEPSHPEASNSPALAHTPIDGEQSLRSATASATNLMHTSLRDGNYPSPPPSVSRGPNRVPTESSVASESIVLPLPNESAKNLADEPSTPLRIPSPVQLPTPDRRPYAYTSALIPFSMERATTPERIPEPKALSIVLSRDTSLATYLKATAPAPQVASGTKQTLKLCLQKANKSIDYDHWQPKQCLKESSCMQFFEFYARFSGVALVSLHALTFDASFTFGGTQRFVVTRYGGEKAWERFKKRLGTLLQISQRDDPDETDFEVLVWWVDLNKDRTSENDLL